MIRPWLCCLALLAGCGGGGSSASGTLSLAPKQPASCPSVFPTDGTSCDVAATCNYDYPPGYHPSGCGATCLPADGSGLVWLVPICI